MLASMGAEQQLTLMQCYVRPTFLPARKLPYLRELLDGESRRCGCRGAHDRQCHVGGAVRTLLAEDENPRSRVRQRLEDVCHVGVDLSEETIENHTKQTCVKELRLRRLYS